MSLSVDRRNSKFIIGFTKARVVGLSNKWMIEIKIGSAKSCVSSAKIALKSTLNPPHLDTKWGEMRAIHLNNSMQILFIGSPEEEEEEEEAADDMVVTDLTIPSGKFAN